MEKNIIREIRRLIVFTAVIFLSIWKYEVVFRIIRWSLDLMTPFLSGGAIAFIIGIPASYIEKKLLKQKSKWIKKRSRFFAIMAVIVCIAGVLSIFLFILIPELGNTLLHLGNSMQTFLSGVEEKSRRIFGKNEEIMRYIDKIEFDWNKLEQAGITFVTNGTDHIFKSALGVMKGIISGVTTFFVSFVFACYILAQREQLASQGKKILYAFVPERKADVFLEILTLSGHTFAGFLTGQCVEALILGCMFLIVMLIVHMPYAVLIGSVIAITALVPVFGAFVGCAVGMLLIFIEDPAKVILFLSIFLILQQIEGNLIYPKVVGNSVGLPSIWVLASVTVGGKLMGVIGMLIFIPIASISYALFREVIYLLLKKRKIDSEKIQ